MKQYTHSRKIIYFVMVLLGSCVQLTMAGSFQYDQLKIKKVYNVNDSQHLDLSGLAYCFNKLITISDKQDRVIYEIKILNQNAQLVPYQQIELQQLRYLSMDFSLLFQFKFLVRYLVTNNAMDWEGIGCQGNHFLLLSEQLAGVLEITPEGQHWYGKLYRQGKSLGLFQKTNTFAEGISYFLSQENFILAQEREPRALIHIKSGAWYQVYQQGGDPGTFSGLAQWQGKLVTLERNHHLVCLREPDKFDVLDCKSYAHVEQQAQYRFARAKYPLAEGVAVTETSLFIILDTNGQPRLQNPEDYRTWLFEFEMPIDW